MNKQNFMFTRHFLWISIDFLYQPGHKAEMDVAPADIDIDFILDERAREMAGEYNRWMDLKRTGKLIERTKKYNNLTSSKGSMDDHILVRPIPQSIIDQTTGYFPQNANY